VNTRRPHGSRATAPEGLRSVCDRIRTEASAGGRFRRLGYGADNFGVELIGIRGHLGIGAILNRMGYENALHRKAKRRGLGLGGLDEF
jgi:hypothetical protein